MTPKVLLTISLCFCGGVVGSNIIAQQRSRTGSTRTGGSSAQPTSPAKPGPKLQASLILPPFPSQTIVRSTAPIELPGNGAVTDAGQANYNLPLQVPEGPGGLKPGLALVYSGGGNGLLGASLSLAGLSVIAPCRQTFASEGWAAGVEFMELRNSDAYCLDGKKLIADNSPPSEDLPASEQIYHMEVESHERIRASYPNGKSNEPGTFTVWRRDGLIATYEPRTAYRVWGQDGETAPTDRNPNPGPGQMPKRPVKPVYVMRELADRKGLNRLVYDYEENADVPAKPCSVAAPALTCSVAHEFSYRISKISYSFTGSTPRRWVRFVYEPRPDLITSNANGVVSAIRSRLRTIEAWAPNPAQTSLVWRYELSYVTSSDTRRSLLHSVQMCEQFGSCSFSRSFDWTQANAGFNDRTISTSEEFDDTALSRDFKSYIDFTSKNVDFLPSTDVRLLVFDADGDGIDDVLYRTKRTWIELSKTEPTQQYHGGQVRFRHSTADKPLGAISDVTPLLEPSLWIAHLGKLRVGDLEQPAPDGIPNLLLARTLYDPHAVWNSPQNKKTELCNYGKWTFGYTDFGGWPWNSKKKAALDQVSISGPVATATSVKKGCSTGFIVAGTNSWKLFTPPFQVALADLDGDGRVEKIDPTAFSPIDMTSSSQDWANIHSDAGIYYETRLAAEAPPAQKVLGAYTCGNGRMRILDLDGDGRDDVLAASDTQIGTKKVPVSYSYVRMYLQDPAQGYIYAEDSLSRLDAGNCSDVIPDLAMGDFNGDGLPDALYLPTAANGTPRIRWNLGTGFGPFVDFPVNGAANLLYQAVPYTHSGNPAPWDRGTRVVDVNGDGRADIVAFRLNAIGCGGGGLFLCGNYQTQAVVYLSAGDHLEGQVVQLWNGGGISLAEGFSTAQVGDVTGDGAMDLIHVVGGKIHVLEMPWRAQPDLLKGVLDSGSLYPLETFEYAREWWGGRPRPGVAACAYPANCSNRGFPVVRRHTTFAGTTETQTPMYRHYRHCFEDPRSDRTGRGFLGFKAHRIWDEERGSETVIVFDNYTRDDLVPVHPMAGYPVEGGSFYPMASRPVSVTTITPIAPLPTQAEIDQHVVMPGLMGASLIDVRVERSAWSYERKGSVAGRVIEIRPKTIHTVEYESTAMADQSSATPFYSIDAKQQQVVAKERTFGYDAFGNVTHDDEVTTGGVHRSVTQIYDHRTKCETGKDPQCWLVGLLRESATRSYAESQKSNWQATRIVRFDYDDRGSMIERRVSAWDGKPCASKKGDLESCEQKATKTKFTLNTRGAVVVETTTAADVPSPRIQRYTYDWEDVFVAAETDAAGHTTVTLRHPALGVPVLTQDPILVKTLSRYDGFGRQRDVTRPGMPKRERTYSEYVDGSRRGIQWTESGADGSGQQETYNERGQLIRKATLSSDGKWLVTRTQYDAFGLVERESRPGVNAPGSDSVRTYDRLNRVLSDLPAGEGVSKYAQQHFTTQVTDPLGHEFYVRWDADGRLIESAHSVNHQPYGKMTFTYDSFDQAATMTDASGNVTSMSYDSLGRRTTLLRPDSGQTAFAYNGFGEVVSAARADGSVLIWARDALGRATHFRGPDGNVQFVWDQGPHAAGRLVSSSGAKTGTSYEYDSLGREKQVTYTVDQNKYQVTRDYDSFGRVKHLFYPEVKGRPRFTIGYLYGVHGYLRQIEDVSLCGVKPEADGVVAAAASFHEPAGIGVTPKPGAKAVKQCVPKDLWTVLSRSNASAAEETALGKAVHVTYSHDEQTGRVFQIDTPSASDLASYGYDHDGNLISRVDGYTEREETFSYDPVHRLTGWTVTKVSSSKLQNPSSAGREYGYDELGNLKTVKTPTATEFSATFGIPGKPHQMNWSSVGGTFTYDVLGRQKTGGGRVIQYSQFDLPLQIASKGETRTFEFDETGQRIKETRQGASSESTVYAGNLYERRQDGSGESHVFYVSGETSVVAQVIYTGQTTVKRYIVSDPLGSPRLVLDEQGAAIERPLYDPFGGRVDASGAPLPAGAASATTIGFTGQEDDGGGLVNMRGRIYDRRQYRFLTPDPLISLPLLGQSHNPYSYALNNPLRYTDPTGLHPDDQNPDGGPVDGPPDIHADQPILPPNPAPARPANPHPKKDADDGSTTASPDGDSIDWVAVLARSITMPISAPLAIGYAEHKALDWLFDKASELLGISELDKASLNGAMMSVGGIPPEAAEEGAHLLSSAVRGSAERAAIAVLESRGTTLFNQIGARMFKAPTETSPGLLRRWMTISIVAPEGADGMKIVAVQNRVAHKLLSSGLAPMFPDEVLAPQPIRLMAGESWLMPPGNVHSEVLGVWSATAMGAKGGTVWTDKPACTGYCDPLFKLLENWIHLNPALTPLGVPPSGSPRR